MLNVSFQYSILMFLIFVTMLLGGILAYVFREKVELTMKHEMLSSTKLYDVQKQVTFAWDRTQSRLRCCGVTSFRDWYDIQIYCWLNKTDCDILMFRYGRIPKTCCQEIDSVQHKPCQDNPSLSNVHADGCYEIGSRFIREKAAVMSASGIIVSILMLVGMIFSCMFFNMIE
jgi:tetraspanin-11